MSIIFTAHESINPVEIGNRIALITEGLCGVKVERTGAVICPVYEIERNARWQIGTGNNFWLSKNGNNEYNLVSRYWNDDQLHAIKTILLSVGLCIA